MKGHPVSALIKLVAIVAFGVIGGYLVSLAGSVIDRSLNPDCNFFRLASVSLFTTFTVVFGTLTLLWPTSNPRDSLP